MNLVANILKNENPYEFDLITKKTLFLNELKKLLNYHFNNSYEYKNFISNNNYNLEVDHINELPFLPARLFKLLDLKSISNQDIFKVMTSIGTSGQATLPPLRLHTLMRFLSQWSHQIHDVPHHRLVLVLERRRVRAEEMRLAPLDGVLDGVGLDRVAQVEYIRVEPLRLVVHEHDVPLRVADVLDGPRELCVGRRPRREPRRLLGSVRVGQHDQHVRGLAHVSRVRAR